MIGTCVAGTPTGKKPGAILNAIIEGGRRTRIVARIRVGPSQ